MDTDNNKLQPFDVTVIVNDTFLVPATQVLAKNTNYAEYQAVVLAVQADPLFDPNIARIIARNFK